MWWNLYNCLLTAILYFQCFFLVIDSRVSKDMCLDMFALSFFQTSQKANKHKLPPRLGCKTKLWITFVWYAASKKGWSWSSYLNCYGYVSYIKKNILHKWLSFHLSKNKDYIRNSEHWFWNITSSFLFFFFFSSFLFLFLGKCLMNFR